MNSLSSILQDQVVQQEPDNSRPVPVLRRSNRVSQFPSYLKNYYRTNMVYDSQDHFDSQCSLPTYPIENYVSTSQLSSSFLDFVSNISLLKEPTTFKQAVKFPEWRDAMKDELDAMVNLQTWKVVPLPAGKQAIDCKWVFRIKHKADGTVDRYKARLVAKGFTQIEGIDFTDTFSPVAKFTSFKVLLTLAAQNDWHMLQLDVNNAFLNGLLDEEAYMKLPQGYVTGVQGVNLAFKLQKSIYGLRQASRQWFNAFSKVVIQFGFTQSSSDHFLFIKGLGDNLVALLVYVNDIVLAGKNLHLLTQVQDFLQEHFKLKVMGDLKYFLGFEIARNSKGISLSQRHYALQLLEDTGSLAKKPSASPLAVHHKLSKDDGAMLEDSSAYRRLVGRLLYLTHTRPDITHDVHLLTQFVSSPRKPHLDVVHHLLSYIKGSHGLGLFFLKDSNLQLRGFVDSDYASCPDTRRSITGHCTFLGNTLISWKSKKQNVVSRSSCEAEYRAMATATCELVWLQSLLSSFQIPVPHVVLYCDNKSAIQLAMNQVFHERTKHIEVDCHFIRDKINSGFLKLLHVRSSNQLADIFTKALPLPAFQSIMSKLGLLNIHQTPT
ncbi:cysteine-rich RLK (RECEPTOR-like protein kinase) 8 [Hibiscus trionum]|uniref:Cysteine-rich RLK (RECEPTOR-like protein kinase) 8 n=1 Tax=Hibiscus trionum TaxID=183268 RepID=A0A9W7HMD9_HIBTR|nr:cysteine-rich RLK (RECEPTOR-like protein kinase) 8 [Hibiscus trionum]